MGFCNLFSSQKEYKPVPNPPAKEKAVTNPPAKEKAVPNAPAEEKAVPKEVAKDKVEMMIPQKPKKSAPPTVLAIDDFIPHGQTNIYPAFVWQSPDITVRQIEYIRFKASKSCKRFQLIFEGTRFTYEIPGHYTLMNAREMAKRMQASVILNGIARGDAEQNRLAIQHMEWLGSPDYHELKRYPSTDGIRIGWPMRMRQLDEPWCHCVKFIVIVEVLLRGKVEQGESEEMNWETSVVSLYKEAAQIMKMEDYSSVAITNHDEILKDWYKTIGELKPVNNIIHLQILFQ